MTVALPSSPLAKSATPRYIDMGAIQSGSLGGEDMRINRLGSRWACDYVLPPMKADAARIWINRLVIGRNEKASFYFPQPGLVIPGGSGFDSPIHNNANANSLGLVLADSVLGWTREGMFMSVRKNGTNRRYVYQIRANGTPTGGAGRYDILVNPPIRSAVTNADRAELGNLCTIEGYVVGDDTRWTIDDAKVYGLQFSIQESG